MAIPIGDMLEAAGRVAEGDYSARVAVRGPREARALTQAFNTMAAGLQANDEQRRRLLADIAHELRTPLTVIQGNLEGMLDGIYPTSPEHIESILEETHTLSRGLDDLRTLSLAESGALRLQLEPIEMEELIHDIAATFRTPAGSSGIALNARVQPDLPAIEIDAIRIREVLSNLILNALRYTPPGGQIEVECKISENDPGQILVIVRDTGTGISPEDIPHIFDRFYKSSDSRGTGLGLAISKSLIQAHGGEISAVSEVDKGTTITFSLPIIPPQPE
jgi:two-component system OmpR family sensor kinase/two-component system sensor histidine kinase BaeS